MPPTNQALVTSAISGGPLGIAAVRAGAPNRQNPQGSPFYQQAYGQSFANMLKQPEIGELNPRPLHPAPAGGTTTPFTAGPQLPSIAQQLAALGNSGGGGGAASTSTNLGAYGGEYPTTPTPSPLNYLGLPNYANLGSNFTGGTNYSNPFVGLFGNQPETNFLSNWT